jgi:hypothetical protein
LYLDSESEAGAVSDAKHLYGAFKRISKEASSNPFEITCDIDEVLHQRTIGGYVTS